VKIAWLTPFSRLSAIGQFSAIIIEALRTRADITVFASDLAEGNDPESWLPGAPILSIPTMTLQHLLDELHEFDICVYNLGDNLAFHRTIYELSVRRPGITVLHDVVMHHFFVAYYLGHCQDAQAYLNELRWAHGTKGQAYGQAVLAGQTSTLMLDPRLLRFNMAKSAIHRSEGVVVHSKFARKTVAAVSEAPVVHIPFPTPRIAITDPLTPALPQRGSEEKVRLLTLGTVNPNKRISEAIAAIGASRYLRQRVVFHVIGSLDNAAYAQEVQRTIDDSGLQEAVFLLGHRPDAELHAYLAQADVIINLRNPHFGESSWSLLEAAFAGKASVVWKHGFYDEFPDDAVAKVSSLADLGPRLEALCRDVQARQALGERVRSFAERTFSTEQYCDRFLAFAQRTQYNRPVLRLTDTAAAMLAELGQSAKSSAADLVAAEISALGANDERVTARSMGIRHGT
jgi:glycosyltransferase involved in cell wall biosynthesis